MVADYEQRGSVGAITRGAGISSRGLISGVELRNYMEWVQNGGARQGAFDLKGWKDVTLEV